MADQLRPPAVPTRSTLVDLFSDPWYPQDALARAYVRAGEQDRAVAEYEGMTAADPERRGRRLVHPLYHYRLGRLYEARDSQAQARREYEAFLAVWGDCDESRVEGADARARLATMR
jgi:hypothetical protein